MHSSAARRTGAEISGWNRRQVMPHNSVRGAIRIARSDPGSRRAGRRRPGARVPNSVARPRYRGCSTSPARICHSIGGAQIACGFEMFSDQGGVLVLRLDGLRPHAGVAAPDQISAATHKRPRGSADAERRTPAAGRRRLIDQLRVDEIAQHGVDLQSRQHARPEPRADDRRSVQRALSGRIEAVDACSDHGVQRAGHADVSRRDRRTDNIRGRRSTRRARSDPARSPLRRTDYRAARSATTSASSVTDLSAPSSSVPNVDICESSSGSRAIVCDRGACASAPPYSGR